MATYTYSKQITRQLNAAERVASSASELAVPIAAALDAKVPDAGNEPKIDWGRLQNVLGLLLTTNAERLRELDEQHAQKEVGSQLLREQRDKAADRLRQELRTARLLFDQKLTREGSRNIFPQRGDIARVSVANLVRLGRHIAAILRDQVPARAPAEPGDSLNAATVALALDAATQALEAILQELEPKLRQEALSLAKRRQEGAEALAAWRGTREVLSGLYQLAGFDYLADQLRERRRKKAMETETGAGEGGAPTEMPPKAAVPKKEEVPMV